MTYKQAQFSRLRDLVSHSAFNPSKTWSKEYLSSQSGQFLHSIIESTNTAGASDPNCIYKNLLFSELAAIKYKKKSKYVKRIFYHFIRPHQINGSRCNIISKGKKQEIFTNGHSKISWHNPWHCHHHDATCRLQSAHCAPHFEGTTMRQVNNINEPIATYM